MIVTALNGGLGNQLFQYALARRLAYDRNIEFRVDVNVFANKFQKRAFQLNHLDVIAAPITDRETQKFWGWRNLRYIGKWHEFSELHKPYYKRIVVREQDVKFDENILRVGTHVYLEGYWQSEKYFTSIASLLRTEIRPNGPWSRENSHLLKQVRDCQAVSVHIRRGDYVENPDVNKTHGVLLQPYYEEAMRIIKGRMANAHFFVFSDDVLWARENLDFHAPTFYISHNENEAHWDMLLMSHCSHHIIANSSFSWWGAWLNQNDEKIVIAPKRWFKADIFNPDLLPEEWIKI
jgi:Glycosyl transferase family 11